MKKIIIGIIFLILIITAFFIVNEIKSGETEAVNSEKKLEVDLAKSMEESKKENKKIEVLLTKVPQELKNKGYGQTGLSFSSEYRIFTVQVEDKEFVKRNRSKVENMIVNIAKEIEFQDFDVNFRVLESDGEIGQEEQKLRESLSKVSKVTSDLFKEKGYHDINYSILLHPKKEIIIEGKNEVLEKKDEIEKLIANTVFSKTNMNFTVKIQKKSENEIRDQNWQPVFSAIREETKREFEEYTGFAYSFHPEPLQIIIKTNLEKPKWFWNSNKKVKQITNYVDKIIELKKEELSIEKIPYAIIIRDKNDKKIN
ncbi:hypothetical protein [Sporosarcina sp. FA9]|uniref:hypothetical protein n=1 Tax=Sporosarcina sp. FA9 TaxID=3413030 RepID=UPI003F65EB6D